MAANEKIAIFEDDSEYAKSLRHALEDQGHTVEVVATTRDGISGGIERVINGRFRVVFADGNLELSGKRGSDGNTVVGELKRRAPKVIVLGYSTDPEDIVGATKSFNKYEELPDEIADYVTSLPIRS